jgi:RluA family pseudouridine synthase
MTKTFRVEEANLKLCQFLKEKLDDAFSLKLIKKTIEKGSCLVNKKVTSYSNHLLKKGDVVEINLVKQEEVKVQVLFEDPSFYIVIKPPGLVSEEKALAPFFKAPIFLVHRLDKETSGLLLIAKSKEIQKYFENLFREKKIIKKYLALCDGLFLQNEGTIDLPLSLAPKGHHKTVAKASSFGDLKAVTIWKKIATGEKATLLELEIKTGKTHQIRSHMSAVGHSVLGDRIYLKKPVCKVIPKSLCLFAFYLKFEHPITGESKEFSTRPGKDFLNALRGALIDAKCLSR